jgi:hypothetical protein
MNDRSESSFWRRFINAMVASRQRKADEHIAEYSRHHPVHQPFKHTLTPADREVIEKCFVGMSMLFGTITLLIVGLLLALHNSAAPTKTQEAVVARCPVAAESCVYRELHPLLIT